jgi:FkbM family methyltransferase
MDLIRTAWDLFPANDVKSSLRVAFQNYKQRGRAHFRRRNGAYSACVLDFTIVTVDPPFQAMNYIDHFQARHRVSKDEVVIEGGTFWGIFTNTLALQVGSGGRVLAFEPDSISFNRTLHNLRLNGNPDHVEVFSKGLWNCESDIGFCERGALGSSAFWDGPGGHRVKIRTTTLDREVFDRKLPRVDYVKMNIEGAEIKALEGADGMIRCFKPHFAISSDHYLNGNTAGGERTSNTVERILAGYGYSVETVKYGTEWVTYGTP